MQVNRLYNSVVKVLASKLFAYGVVALAAFQGAWIAFTARYPMAFDETYHYELTKMHGNLLSPIIYHQPPGMAPYGALARDPSQLYHWVLSFPQRLLEALGASDYATIVTLRLLSLGIFLGGLWLFRRFLLKTTASAAAIHAAMLFFILLPTVPLVSGELNYDNLQFLLFPLALILTINVAKELKAGKLPVIGVLQVMVVCLLGCLNKYTFLPFITAITIYLGWLIFRQKTGRLKRATKSWKSAKPLSRRLLLGSFAVLTGLFGWFYGVNLVVYKIPVIQCHQVISPQRCSAFAPWDRNYRLAQEQKPVSHSPVKFAVDWVGGMFYRLFFTINGADGPKRFTNHVAIPISVAAALLIAVGSVLTICYGPRILRNDPVLRMALFAILVYLAAMIGRSYNDLVHLNQMVAINGRYLHPLLLPMMVLMIGSYQWAFRLMPGVKLAILATALMLFCAGGGITGFIHYSDQDWYFEGKLWIVQLNDFARKLVAPLFLWRT